MSDSDLKYYIIYTYIYETCMLSQPKRAFPIKELDYEDDGLFSHNT